MEESGNSEQSVDCDQGPIVHDLQLNVPDTRCVGRIHVQNLLFDCLGMGVLQAGLYNRKEQRTTVEEKQQMLLDVVAEAEHSEDGGKEPRP